jgi:hypothetical protein
MMIVIISLMVSFTNVSPNLSDKNFVIQATARAVARG